MGAGLPSWDEGLFENEGSQLSDRGAKQAQKFSDQLCAWLNSSDPNDKSELARGDVDVSTGEIQLSDAAVDRFAIALEELQDISVLYQALQLSLKFRESTLVSISTETRFVKACVYHLDELLTMQPTADLDAAMAAITEVLHNIAVSVAEANAAKLSPILHTAIPMLMKVPELYREVEGKLSKSRINLLLHALQAIIMMIQADTEENSLSQVVDDDEEMHSEFLQALVDLIPVVCDLELQLIAVETAANVCARDASAKKTFMKYMGTHSSYKPSLTKTFRSIDLCEPDSGAEKFVRDMHKLSSRSKFKVPKDKQMHIWDVQASLDEDEEAFEATVVFSKNEIYLTNMLTDPDDLDGIDQRWNPDHVERRLLQLSDSQDAPTTLVLHRRREGENDDYAATFTLTFDSADSCDQAARTIETICRHLSRTSTRPPSISPNIISSSSRVERPTLAISVTGTCTTPDPDAGDIGGSNNTGNLQQNEASSGYSDRSKGQKSIRIEEEADIREYDDVGHADANGREEYDSDDNEEPSISLSDSEPSQNIVEDEDDFKPNLRQPSPQSDDDEEDTHSDSEPSQNIVEDEDDFKPNLRQPSPQSDDDEEDTHSQQMSMLRDQLAAGTENGNDEGSILLREGSGRLVNEDPQLLDGTLNGNISEATDEVRIRGKLLRNFTVAELKVELKQRLPKKEIPTKWPRKSELIEMLESSIQARRGESQSESEVLQDMSDEQNNDEDEEDDKDDDNEINEDNTNETYFTEKDVEDTQDSSSDQSENEESAPQDDVNHDADGMVPSDDEYDSREDLVLQVQGKQLKDLRVPELKLQLQSRLDDSIIQDLSKPRWPRKAELVRLLEVELRKQHGAHKQKLCRAKTKPSKPEQTNSARKSRLSRHKLSIAAQDTKEMHANLQIEDQTAGDDELFDKAAAEYAHQNPQEAKLAATKSSPFVAKSKQYTSRRNKQLTDTNQTQGTLKSDGSSPNDLTKSRSNKQPANTGKMNALVADLSETEAVGRRHKKAADDNKRSGGKAAAKPGDAAASKHDDVSHLAEPSALGQSSGKKQPVVDRSNSAQAAAVGGVFDEIFDDETVESEDRIGKNKKRKTSPSPVPRRQQSKRVAAAAAAAATAACAAAESESSSSEDEYDDDGQAELSNVGEFNAEFTHTDDFQTGEISDDKEEGSNDDDDEDEDIDALSNVSDEQEQIAVGLPEQDLSSFIEDMLDEDASQDPENHDGVCDPIDGVHNKVIYRNVNGVQLNQFQIPSPGVSPMQNTQKKLSFLEGSDEDSLSESEDEDTSHISGIVDFDEIVYPDCKDDDDVMDHESDFMDDNTNRQSMADDCTTSLSIESQIIIRSVHAKIKSVGKMRRKGQKQEALRQSRNAQALLSSVASKESTKVETIRKTSLAPIHKNLKKRATAIKRAKEHLAQEYAMFVATHQTELKRLDAIANAARACAQDIDAAREESQSALKEKHNVFMDTYISQNEGFVGKVKVMAKKDPRQENFAKMMELLNASA